MSGHQVRLRWTTHQGTLFGVLQSLLGKNFLVDVTLAAEGQYVRAHKVILCACSPYFEELLSITDDKHPIIMLQDVKYCQLQALISYMYCGEVNIDEANLPALLRIAEALQIRGLFGTSSSSSSPSKHDNDDSTDGDETPITEPKCWSSQDRVNNSSDLLTPPPSKKVKSGNSTNTNSSFGPPRSSDMQTNCESKSPRKESGDATMSPEAVVANSSSASSSTSQPAGSSSTNNKRGSKSERNRRTSISTQSSVPDTQNKIDKDVDSTPQSADSDSLEPNQSYLFENYFSSEESFRDEIIIPASPPPDDDDKDEEHTQEDGLPLGANADQIFRCFKCGKQYTSNKSLWRHRKFACEGKQTFSCQLCGKSFSRSDNLRRHAVVAHCIQ